MLGAEKKEGGEAVVCTKACTGVYRAGGTGE